MRFKYRTLSYEWGTPQHVHKILINGSPFSVRENLHSFLVHLNTYHGGKKLGYLWVDTLCIDQGNDEERHHQVQSMKQIYGGATETLAWTGPSYDTWDYNLFRTIKQCRSCEQGSWKGYCESVVEPKFFYSNIWLEEGRCGAFIDFCEWSYWSRFWVVQELALAKEARIFCGRYSHDRDSLREIMDGRFEYNADNLGACQRVTDCLHALHNIGFSDFERTLLRRCMSFGKFQCTMPHDRIYGLLGIADDVDSFNVDYTISLEALLLIVLQSMTADTTFEEIYNLAMILELSFIAEATQLL